MERIKLFENFKNISEMYYGGKYEFLGSFGRQDFQEHLQVIRDWQARTGKNCRWCTYNAKGREKDFWNCSKKYTHK